MLSVLMYLRIVVASAEPISGVVVQMHMLPAAEIIIMLSSIRYDELYRHKCKSYLPSAKPGSSAIKAALNSHFYVTVHPDIMSHYHLHL
jgi:hypothetical protein